MIPYFYYVCLRVVFVQDYYILILFHVNINLDKQIPFTDFKKRLDYATSIDNQLLVAFTANCQF